MRALHLLLALLTIGSVALAGCASDDGSESTDNGGLSTDITVDNATGNDTTTGSGGSSTNTTGNDTSTNMTSNMSVNSTG